MFNSNLRNYIWECDYGEHSRFINLLDILLSEQNSTELCGCALFVNNNPYNLEFFVVLSYEKPREEQIERTLRLMRNEGARHRPDIPINELIYESSRRRYNFMSVVDSFNLELAKNNLFEFQERSAVAEIISMKPLGKNIPVFLSHASVDKPLVEDVIPYLNAKGLPVWYDNISIDYGEGILSAVQNGVRDSGAVIFFMTTAFLNSSWCKAEMEGFLSRYAGGQNVLLLTVKSHEVPRDRIPFFLQGIKYLPLKADSTPEYIAKELIPILSKRFGVW